ncbi:MAG: PAS domain-containing sensor histidine kinase [Alphaproteobacteria bacterium]|nr:PAS domain-containing sensor histidine kinase [Alphaproteobacteria bacterium]
MHLNKLNKILLKALALARSYHLAQALTIALSVLAVILAFVTYYALVDAQPLDGSSTYTVVLLNCDLAVLLSLSFVVAYRLMRFKQKRISGAASKLHARLIRWFGMLLVTPAIIITLFSASFFNLGIESWFSKHVRAAIRNSTSVAEAYLNEHNKGVATEAITLAGNISRMIPITDPEAINEFVNEQASMRSLNEAILFTPDGTVLAQTRLSFSLLFQLDNISHLDYEEAKNHPVIYHSTAQDRVRAFVRIDPRLDIYLIVGRYVDPKVLAHISNTQIASSEYKKLEQYRSEIEIKFILIFMAFSIILLMFVIWIGMAFASRLAAPITALISASEKIRAGDLTARVPEMSSQDEFGLLSLTFNRMTSELQLQRDKLVEYNIQIDRRRHFIETVLSGVSAGVLGLDANYAINVANKSARNLLGLTQEELLGRRLQDLMPTASGLLDQARDGPVQSQIQFVQNEKAHTLLVRIVIEREDEVIVGYILTFDDMTQLMHAQRKAAWSDVARRIAHEIKNPLTPIQLSAERLKKKYTAQITEDAETFHRYIDTISRQVSYIGEMVREFSEFARMPETTLQRQNLNELCEEAVFLQRNAKPAILFEFAAMDAENYMYCDPSQMSQLLTNLLINAIDSVESRIAKQNDLVGKIRVELLPAKDHIVLLVADNGEGFPRENRDNLMEPYVTHREKGTGLGLAIVRRIVEAHNGTIALEDNDMNGASIRIVLPRSESGSNPSPGEQGSKNTMQGSVDLSKDTFGKIKQA